MQGRRVFFSCVWYENQNPQPGTDPNSKYEYHSLLFSALLGIVFGVGPECFSQCTRECGTGYRRCNRPGALPIILNCHTFPCIPGKQSTAFIYLSIYLSVCLPNYLLFIYLLICVELMTAFLQLSHSKHVTFNTIFINSSNKLC